MGGEGCNEMGRYMFIFNNLVSYFSSWFSLRNIDTRQSGDINGEEIQILILDNKET